MEVKKETVSDIINEAIKEMCESYCKFPGEAERLIKDEDEREAWLEDICAGCPVHRLGC